MMGTIRPQKPIAIGRIEKDTNKLTALYEQGYADAKEHLEDVIKISGEENIKTTIVSVGGSCAAGGKEQIPTKRQIAFLLTVGLAGNAVS